MNERRAIPDRSQHPTQAPGPATCRVVAPSRRSELQLEDAIQPTHRSQPSDDINTTKRYQHAQQQHPTRAGTGTASRRRSCLRSCAVPGSLCLRGCRVPCRVATPVHRRRVRQLYVLAPTSGVCECVCVFSGSVSCLYLNLLKGGLGPCGACAVALRIW